MLLLPTTGFNRSVTRNNVRRDTLGDWLESSALFLGTFSKVDAVDILTEQGVTDSQDLAHEVVDEGWAELEERFRSSGPPSTISLDADRLVQNADWRDDPARSFMVMLSAFLSYPDWANAHRDANAQGVLFERVSAAACAEILGGWTIYRAGWSPSGGKDIPAIVTELADLLGTGGHANPAQWAGESANDAGLDLMCFRPFPDGREGVPVIALQCASGDNWRKKLTEPSTNLWQKLLDSSFEPTRALSIPYVVDREELPRRCAVILGPLFDRNRILSAGQINAAWIDPHLATDLIAWLEPRVAALPVAE